MEKIGQILKKDYLLLQETDLNNPNLSEELLEHANSLKICGFQEFRLLIPHQTPEITIQLLQNFIESQPIPGALRYYIQIDNQSQFDKEVLLNPELSFKDWVAVLPTEDFRYENFSKKIWNLSKGGKAIMILLPERVNQWRSRQSYFKRLYNKGASFAFSGSSKYNMGFLHKFKVKQIHKEGIIHLWLTPQIYNTQSKLFAKDMAIKLDAISSISTNPNDL